MTKYNTTTKKEKRERLTITIDPKLKQEILIKVNSLGIRTISAYIEMVLKKELK